MPRRKLSSAAPEMVAGSINHYPARIGPRSTRYLGGPIAHNELIRHLLSTGAVDRVDLFPASGPGPGQPHEREAFRHFASADYLGAPRAPRLSSWEQMLTTGPPSVFVSSLPWTQRLAQLRLPSGAPRPGIASVIHSVPWPDLLATYWSLGATSAEADVVVATSRAAEKAIRQLLDWSNTIGPTRRHVRIARIPLGVGADDLPASAARTARDELGIGADEIVILFLGRLDPVYKADLSPLLVAVHGLPREPPSVRLVIAGSDDRGYAATLQQLAQDLGIAAIVRVVSSPDAGRKAALLACCDIFVTPSDNIQESFGLTVLEAMACSKPVVASDWDGYRDLVLDGETGFLVRTVLYRPCLDAADLFLPVDPSTQFTTGFLASQTIVDVRELTDKLAVLVRSPELRTGMGEAGRRRVIAEFSWPMVATRYRELFDEQVRINRRAPKPLPGPLANAFGHYSTTIIDAATKVQATTVPAVNEILTSGVAGPADAAKALLDRARRPIEIADLAQEAPGHAMVMRLLKLGILGAVESGPVRRNSRVRTRD